MSWNETYNRYLNASHYGLRITGEVPWSGYRAKPGSHDDGAHHGPFLGGLGAGGFSRDMYGRFTRWHLQPGVHFRQVIPQARLLLRWNVGDEAGSAGVAGGIRYARQGARFLGTGACPGWGNYVPEVSGFAEQARSYAVLYPECFEYYDDPDVPVRVLLHYWSPLVFGDESAASLPVVYFSVALESRASRPVEVGVALFWPNLLGLRAARVTSVDRGDRLWPGQWHSGNTARAGSLGDEGGRADVRRGADARAGTAVETGAAAGADAETTAVVQSRRPEQAVGLDMEGEVGLSMSAPFGGTLSRELCMKSDLNATGVPPEKQRYTQAWAETVFLTEGRLPETEKRWRAHWHEPLSSAVAASTSLGPGVGTSFEAVLAWDMPVVSFGSERRWNKRYTREHGDGGRGAEALLSVAATRRDEWYERMTEARASVLDNITAYGGPDANRAGAVLNELFLAGANGTAWVDGERSRPEGLAAPRLGGGEHFAFLEGFDTGYYYYNTLDLWVYAFPALTLTWPGLAEGIFADYLRSLETPDERRRVVYRPAEERRMLAPGKAPHDLGCPMGDPWHELNGYTMRDDPNGWKDHNPALIVAFYLHTRLLRRAVRPAEWELLKTAASWLLDSVDPGDGLPRHREFGDSTWDALAFRGVSAYSGGLTLAAYRVIEEVAAAHGEHELSERCRRLRAAGTRAFDELLWSGSFYRTDSEGRYREAVMADALLGPYYASLAGLTEVLARERIDAHLRAAFDYNVMRYGGGEHGALLVADERAGRFVPDGGEELQVNEVIVGSAWALCAMLQWYGHADRSDALARSLRRIIYGRSGLQFRTPAAWDAEGRFRAPLNMRPLSVWLQAANAFQGGTA
ncbi:MAG: GH116 family glycosyl hydrolase [Spirochaetaceae bacterium]